MGSKTDTAGAWPFAEPVGGSLELCSDLCRDEFEVREFLVNCLLPLCISVVDEPLVV